MFVCLSDVFRRSECLTPGENLWCTYPHYNITITLTFCRQNYIDVMIIYGRVCRGERCAQDLGVRIFHYNTPIYVQTVNKNAFAAQD